MSRILMVRRDNYVLEAKSSSKARTCFIDSEGREIYISVNYKDTVGWNKYNDWVETDEGWLIHKNVFFEDAHWKIYVVRSI